MNALQRLYRRIFPFSAAGAGVPGIQGDDHLHALRLKQSARLLARRASRPARNARARLGAATKIHQQFERDPLIKARTQA